MNRDAAVRTLSPAESAAITEFLTGARRILGNELLEVRLFGSRARGTGDEDSDLDLALIVTAAGRERRHPIYDLAFDVGLRHDVQLAPLLLTTETLAELRARERRLAHDLECDGVRL